MDKVDLLATHTHGPELSNDAKELISGIKETVHGMATQEQQALVDISSNE